MNYEYNLYCHQQQQITTNTFGFSLYIHTYIHTAPYDGFFSVNLVFYFQPKRIFL